MAEPDFRQLDADAGGDSLPQNRHFCCHSVALAPQREITKVFPCREQHIDMLLHTIKIERQVKSVPTGEWRREDICHGVSIGARMRN